ncbi:YafY family protein [Agarivorans sp. 1_MG-2023]|uniref:helix-turn-helix transcriptional regulator n=1 Tax=Agarivorans sp. 1_MG-2023 TaxID=3062634 RepID=UPI0026E2596E|nr:WYL domain-containing transcriptional regulator [Agarivorans sp. 1_MG-2023]MDO6765909.1 WYL domain-containing transcriptional regulator [Agarivorans sp. 1_MG-2023]
MSLAKDPLLRQLSMLQMIPKPPGRIASTTLMERLLERGFEVSERTIQRDLQKLSSIFPLIVDESSKPYRWSLTAEYSSSLPAIDTATSLAFALAEPFLKRQLPNAALSLITRETNQAKRHLNALQQNELSKWRSKVRTIPDGLQFVLPEINQQVWQQLSDALLHEQQVKVSYYSRKKSKERELILNPLGIVNKSKCSYLVAIVEGYETPTIYALHRFRKAQVQAESCASPADFNLDEYLQSGALGWSESPQAHVMLIANISSELAITLKEAPISDSQKIQRDKQEPRPYRLMAKVPNNKETLWWLFSLNSRIHVLEPDCWVNEIKKTIEELADAYAV